MSDRPVLQLNQISKTFVGTVAVDSLSFGIFPGSVFGLLGPNGAGKTTTLRIVLNIMEPDSGEVTFGGGEDGGGPDPCAIGYLPEERGLYGVMRTREQLAFLGELKGLNRADAMAATDRWLGRVGLEAVAQTLVRDLSKGQQQLVQFCGAVLHSPRLLVLDEPFAGLDPVATVLLKDVLQSLVSDGAAVLLSTHLMDHAAQLCSEVCILQRGRSVESGPPAEICQRLSAGTLEEAFVKLAGQVSEAEVV